MKAFQEHLNKWLLGYVLLAMLLGLLIGGQLSPGHRATRA